MRWRELFAEEALALQILNELDIGSPWSVEWRGLSPFHFMVTTLVGLADHGFVQERFLLLDMKIVLC